VLIPSVKFSSFGRLFSNGELNEVGQQTILSRTLPILGGNRDGTATAHSVSRAYADVQHRQSKLTNVDFDGPQVGNEFHLDLDVPA